MLASVEKLAGDAINRTSALLRDPASPLHRVLGYSEDLETYLTQLAAIHSDATEVFGAVTGPIVSFPAAMRSAISQVMPPIDAVVEGLENLDGALCSLAEHNDPSDLFVLATDSVVPLFAELVERHLSNYTDFIPLVQDNLGPIQTLVQTIDTVIEAGGVDGLGLQGMQNGMLAFMESIIPGAKQQILEEGATAARRIQRAAMQRLQAMLGSFNHTEGRASAIASAETALAEAPRLLRDAEAISAGAMAQVRGDTSSAPLDVALERGQSDIVSTAAVAIDDWNASMAVFVQSLTQPESLLAIAASTVDSEAEDTLVALKRRILPAAGTAVANLLQSQLQLSMDTVSSSALSSFLELGDLWEAPTTQAAFRDWMLPHVETSTSQPLPANLPTSAFAGAALRGIELVRTSAADAEPAVSDGVRNVALDLRSTIPDTAPSGDLAASVRAFTITKCAEVASSSAGGATGSELALGVPMQEVLWASVMQMAELVGTPSDITRCKREVNTISGQFATTLGTTEFARVHSTFNFGVIAAAANPTTFSAAARAKVARMAAALAVIQRDVVQANTKIPFVAAMALAGDDEEPDLRTRVVTAAFDVIEMADKWYWRDDPDVDALISGGLATLRRRMPHRALVGTMQQVSATIELLAGLSAVVTTLEDMGGLLQPAADARAAATATTTPKYRPNVAAMKAQLSPTGIDTTILGEVVSVATAPAFAGLLHRAQARAVDGFARFAVTRQAELWALRHNLAACASHLETHVSSGHAGFSKEVAAFRRLLGAVTSLQARTQAVDSTLASSEGAQLLQALAQFDWATRDIVPYEGAYGSPSNAWTEECTASVAAVNDLVLPAATRVAAYFRTFYGPVASMTLHDDAASLVELAETSSPLTNVSALIAVSRRMLSRHGPWMSIRGWSTSVGWLPTRLRVVRSSAAAIRHMATTALHYVDGLPASWWLKHPLHDNVLAAFQCLVDTTTTFLSSTSASPKSSWYDGSIEDLEGLATPALASLAAAFGGLATGMEGCLASGVVPKVLGSDGFSMVAPTYCTNVTVNNTVASLECTQVPTVSPDGEPCTPVGSDACVENSCTPRLEFVLSEQYQCNAYLSFKQATHALYQSNLMHVIHDAQQDAQSARATLALQRMHAALRSLASVDTVVQQAQALRATLQEAIDAPNSADKLRTRVAAASRGGLAGIAALTLDAMSSVRASAFSRLLNIARSARSEASALIATDSTHATVVETLTSSIGVIISHLETWGAQEAVDDLIDLSQAQLIDVANFTHALAATDQAASAVRDSFTVAVGPSSGIVHIQTMLGALGGVRGIPLSAGSLVPQLLAVLHRLENTMCMQDAAIAARHVAGWQTPDPLASSISAAARATWLQEELMEPMLCAAQLLPGVETDDLSLAVGLATPTLRVWERMAGLRLSTLAAPAVPTLAPALASSMAEMSVLFSMLVAPVGASHFQAVVDVASSVEATLPWMVHDRDVRLKIALCRNDTEAHGVVIAAANAVAAARAARDAAATAVTDLSGAGSISDGAALAWFATLPRLAASLATLEDMASAVSDSAISMRDSVTDPSTLAFRAHEWLETLKGVAAVSPLNVLLDDAIGALAEQLSDSANAISAVSAIDDFMVWVLSSRLRGSALVVGDVLGSADSLAEAASSLRKAPSSASVYRLHSSLVSSAVLTPSLSAPANAIAVTHRDLPVREFDLSFLSEHARSSLALAAATVSTVATSAVPPDGDLLRLAGAATAAVGVGDFSASLSKVLVDVRTAVRMRSLDQLVTDAASGMARLAIAATAEVGSASVASQIENLRGAVADTTTAATLAFGEPEQDMVDALMGVAQDTAGVRAVAVAASRLQNRTCDHAPLPWCLRMHAMGITPQHCCVEVAVANLTRPASCGVTDCVAVHTAASSTGQTNVIPAECCAELRVNGLVSADCPVLSDCETLVASGIEPLPARCCVDARTKQGAESSPSCAIRSDFDCARCALARTAEFSRGDWGFHRDGTPRVAFTSAYLGI